MILDKILNINFFKFFYDFNKINKNYLNKIKIKYKNFYNIFFKFFSKSLVFLIISLFLFFSLIFFKYYNINKILFLWFSFSMVYYWLISNFVFFFKKYQYSKFTSVIQRFWKRSLILFWILELFLFSIFLFLTLNASNEPYHMFDSLYLYKLFLTQWILILKKLLFYFIFLIIVFLTTLFIKLNNNATQYITLTVTTVFLILIFFTEFYQFFHSYQLYNNKIWTFKDSLNIWNLESDDIKTRTINHYLFLLTILKFWHIIFILIYWFFSITKFIEKESVSINLYASNVINFIFLFLFLFLILLFWFKFFYKKYFDYSYFWFFLNPKHLFFKLIFTEFKNIQLFNFNTNFINFNTSFFYINMTSTIYNYSDFIFSPLKSKIIQNLI